MGDHKGCGRFRKPASMSADDMTFEISHEKRRVFVVVGQ